MASARPPYRRLPDAGQTYTDWSNFARVAPGYTL